MRLLSRFEHGALRKKKAGPSLPAQQQQRGSSHRSSPLNRANVDVVAKAAISSSSNKPGTLVPSPQNCPCSTTLVEKPNEQRYLARTERQNIVKTRQDFQQPIGTTTNPRLRHHLNIGFQMNCGFAPMMTARVKCFETDASSKALCHQCQ